MAKHQIIYTSCMRGIDGVNDGQQIFSYDESFSESKSDDVKGLFTYQVPSLPAGTLMSEEIAKTMPVSFMYRLLKNGSAAITLNTYLGRDYMGSAGRFGNHLSHSIVCDFSDFDVYPCEMYASTEFRSSMEFEEVNNPNPPEYLPTPNLTRGYVIDTDSIIEFLGIGDNLEYYKKMVAAMLRFPVEKRRIVICDEPDNIARWIAALHYTLPLDIAKKINFTTYEYDPELSPSQICGVIAEGSRYNVSEYIASNRHYVFDFINHQFSEIQAEGHFIDFLDTAFSFSYESLTEFHEFVINKTIYRECSTDYCTAYYLYILLTEGIGEITQEEFNSIVDFFEKYLTDHVKRELIEKLTYEGEAINGLDHEYALRILGFMLQSLNILNTSQQSVVKQMIVDRLILSLSTDGTSESTFIPLYNSIDEMARKINLSIPAELMVEKNRNSLIGVLEQHVELWKILFIIRIISDFVKDMMLPTDELYPDHAIGKIYYGVVRMVYTSSRKNGYEVVERIMDNFKDNVNYYVNISLNLEGFLKDLELKESDFTHLWEHFYSTTLAMDADDIELVNRYLEEYHRYDEMYQLYDRQIRMQPSFHEVRDYFSDYWQSWFLRYPGYGKEYAKKAIRDYEQIYEQKDKDISDKDSFTYATEILELAMRMHVKEDYVMVLCQAICAYIPLEKVSSDNLKIINKIYQYYREVLQSPIQGRLLLFWIALQLDNVTAKQDVMEVVQEIKNVESKNGGAVFEGLSDGKIKDYFEWAFDSVSHFNLLADDFRAIYELFSFNRQTQKPFMEYWCKTTYKKSKNEKNYADFTEFLTFMFELGSSEDQEIVGKYLCKLSKQKLDNLNMEMRSAFKDNKNAARAWKNVKEIAASTNPILNNLSGLFKRR